MTDVAVLAQVRGLIRQYFATSNLDVQPVMGDGGELITVAGLPERSELVRLGKSWGAAIPTGSAFTYVNAWPTTRAELVMVNGENPNGPSYLIDRVWMANVTGGQTGANYAILGQLTTIAGAGATGAAIADNSAILRHQLSGRAVAYNGNAKFALANVQFAIANQWFPLGQSPIAGTNSAAPAVGFALEALTYGRLIVPPGGVLNLAGISSTAAGTAIIGLDWHEVLLNLA